MVVGAGTGTYIGDGLMLTNWHLCSRRADVLHFNEPETEAGPYREGRPLDGYDCGDERIVQQRPESPDTSCLPIAGIGDVRFEGDPLWSGFDFVGARLQVGGRVLFAQKSIDLCIVQLDESVMQRLPPAMRTLRIDRTKVREGQEVVVAGYPLGGLSRVEELCTIIERTVLRRDPDLVSASDAEVPSFAIDCKTIQHGSSGSLVLDRQTRALLGIVWTASCPRIRECIPPVYVSAASDWDDQGGRPVAQYSRLQELLDRFDATLE